MNDSHPDPGLEALFVLARAHRPDTAAAEFAFETRLLARLRAARSSDSIWARVSWRLVPFFALGVVALTLWQSDMVDQSNEAAAIAGIDNPEAVELWNNLN